MSTTKKSFMGNPAIQFITAPEPKEPTEQVQELPKVSAPVQKTEHPNVFVQGQPSPI